MANGVPGRVFRDAILRWGLKVFCPRCQARGRFFRPPTKPDLRLREVRCARILSDGETVCGGRLFAAPRAIPKPERDAWPNDAMPYNEPQLSLGLR